MLNRWMAMASVVAMAATMTIGGGEAEAGCGCAKPPPALTMVRPAFASPGDVVTLFPPDNKPGEYDLKVLGYRLKAKAVYKRDLADGQYKWQIPVVTPALPAGPLEIEVKGPGRDFRIPSSDFTVMQAPLALQQGDTETVAKCYRAAVTANNVVLIPLDISHITDHMIFNGLGEGYPLLFGAADVMIYNTQGFLMQLLTPEQAGIYEIADQGQPDSFALTYDRHEFNTYRADHAHIGGLGLDPLDRAWHTDGSYHVDHDRLVLAIKGTVEGQGPPPAGRTPGFDLRITTALAEENGGTPTTRTIQWGNGCAADPATASAN